MPEYIFETFDITDLNNTPLVLDENCSGTGMDDLSGETDDYYFQVGIFGDWDREGSYTFVVEDFRNIWDVLRVHDKAKTRDIYHYVKEF